MTTATKLHTVETTSTIKTIGLLAAAPFIGLVYAVALPFIGAAVLVVWLVKALLQDRRILKALRNIALFFAAPFVGLGYIVLMPFVGVGALVWMAVKPQAEARIAGLVAAPVAA